MGRTTAAELIVEDDRDGVCGGEVGDGDHVVVR